MVLGGGFGQHTAGCFFGGWRRANAGLTEDGALKIHHCTRCVEVDTSTTLHAPTLGVITRGPNQTMQKQRCSHTRTMFVARENLVFDGLCIPVKRRCLVSLRSNGDLVRLVLDGCS